MTPIEILDKTEHLLRTQGWGQGNQPGDLLHRLYQVVGLRFGHSHERQYPALREAANALRAHLRVQHLSMWNDDPNRTIVDVYAAIAGARQRLQEVSASS